MKLCPTCDRHLFGAEVECPFCGEEQATTKARPSGPISALVLALSLGATACGTVIEPDPAQSETGATTVGGGDTDTTSALSTTTNGTTSPMTDEGSTAIASTTEGEDADDNPCAFYAGCPPDVDADPYECDRFLQDCAEGEKCMPWANDGGNSYNATRCVPIAPDPGAPGEPCTIEGAPTSGLDSCEEGVMCFDVDPGTGVGTCIPMCVGSEEDPACAAPEQVCVIGSDGHIALCYDACDPVSPACDPGQGCYPSFDPELLTCDTATGEDLPHGEPCTFDESCASGHACLDAVAFPDCAGAFCCSQFCELLAGDPCPGAEQGVVCVPWYDSETVGICGLPS